MLCTIWISDCNFWFLALKLNISCFLLFSFCWNYFYTLNNQQSLDASAFKPCLSMYRFRAFIISWSFLSWNDNIRSWADLWNTGEDVLKSLPFISLLSVALFVEDVPVDDVAAWRLVGETDVAGATVSGVYSTCPSNIFVMVTSTFFVRTAKKKLNLQFKTPFLQCR